MNSRILRELVEEIMIYDGSDKSGPRALKAWAHSLTPNGPWEGAPHRREDMWTRFVVGSRAVKLAVEDGSLGRKRVRTQNSGLGGQLSWQWPLDRQIE